MKLFKIEILITILIATVPMLWIKDYTITNPVWWTVIFVWSFGVLFGEWKEYNSDK